MKYVINFQFKYGTNKRPTDDGDLVPLRFDENSSHNIPNKGDYVNIFRGSDNKEVFGKVIDRLFMYSSTSSGNEACCNVNIVLEEISNEDGGLWSALIKE